mmetsp:Transcript_35378/g.45617  ORF Transcript_35378/g.45617 Transcript_35378/m.45617 type:complete len:588 (+) Transcript_35378:64-1827(+)
MALNQRLLSSSSHHQRSQDTESQEKFYSMVSADQSLNGNRLLEDSSYHDNQREDNFVANSLLDLSNHDKLPDPEDNRPKIIPRLSRMSDGDHREYSGLYSEGGLLGNWKPPPDPKIAARKKLIKQRKIMAIVALMICLGIALVCIFAVPVYIQGLIDDSKLKITSIVNITNPGIHTVDLAMDAVVKCGSPFEVHLHSGHSIIKFQDANSKSWHNVVKMKLPPIRVKGSREHVPIRETVKIMNFNNWNSFSRAVMNDDNVKMRIVSDSVSIDIKGWMSFLGINYHGLVMDKTISVKGMGGLPGAVVLDYDVFNDPDNGGKNGLDAPPIQVATVRVPNYSGFSASGVGFLSGKVLYNSMNVGWLTTTKNESILYGDDNVFVLSGPLTPSNITEFCELMSGYLTGSDYTISLHLSNYTKTVSNTQPSPSASPVTLTSLKPIQKNEETEEEGTKVNVPCSSEYLYNEALQGFSFSAYLSWPEGRVNMTLENIIDIEKLHPGTIVDVPLWIGIYNPFSANIFLTSTDFNVYWNIPSPVPAPSSPPSPLPSLLPYPLPSSVPSSLPTDTPTLSPISPSPATYPSHISAYQLTN